jgi:hypothetical protein
LWLPAELQLVAQNPGPCGATGDLAGPPPSAVQSATILAGVKVVHPRDLHLDPGRGSPRGTGAEDAGRRRAGTAGRRRVAAAGYRRSGGGRGGAAQRSLTIWPQQFWLGPQRARQIVTFWIDTTTVRLCLDGVRLKTQPRLSVVDLARLRHGEGRVAGPPPAAPSPAALARGAAVEVDRTVNACGLVVLASQGCRSATRWRGNGSPCAWRNSSYVMADGTLRCSLPSPIPPDGRGRLRGARLAGPPPAPAQCVVRRPHGDPERPGKFHQAAVLNLYSRRCLGFAMGTHHDAGAGPGGAVHGDRGARGLGRWSRVPHQTGQPSAPASRSVQACGWAGVTQWMGRTGCPVDYERGQTTTEAASPPEIPFPAAPRRLRAAPLASSVLRVGLRVAGVAGQCGSPTRPGRRRGPAPQAPRARAPRPAARQRRS